MLVRIIVIFVAFVCIESGAIASPCNDVVVDEGDPTTIQLAQLQAIRCLIETSARQHLEILNAIKEISVAPPSQTNFYDVLIVLISSLVFVWFTKLVVRTVQPFL